MAIVFYIQQVTGLFFANFFTLCVNIPKQNISNLGYNCNQMIVYISSFDICKNKKNERR